MKGRQDGERGGGDYSKEAIILNISTKEGRLLFEEIRYLNTFVSVLFPLPRWIT